MINITIIVIKIITIIVIKNFIIIVIKIINIIGKINYYYIS